MYVCMYVCMRRGWLDLHIFGHTYKSYIHTYIQVVDGPMHAGEEEALRNSTK